MNRKCKKCKTVMFDLWDEGSTCHWCHKCGCLRMQIDGNLEWKFPSNTSKKKRSGHLAPTSNSDQTNDS